MNLYGYAGEASVKFVAGIFIHVFGAVVTVKEIIQNSGFFFIALGALFSMLGGYYAYRVKKLEWDIKSKELNKQSLDQ